MTWILRRVSTTPTRHYKHNRPGNPLLCRQSDILPQVQKEYPRFSRAASHVNITRLIANIVQARRRNVAKERDWVKLWQMWTLAVTAVMLLWRDLNETHEHQMLTLGFLTILACCGACSNNIILQQIV